MGEFYSSGGVIDLEIRPPDGNRDEMKMIHIECSVLQDGAADLEVDHVTGGYELPVAPAGVRVWADITIAVPVGSASHSALEASREAGEPLRIDGYEGKWLVDDSTLPGIPSDGLARLTLTSTG